MMPKRRTILKPCLFLLLGAIINIAVAWGCSMLWSPQWRSSQFGYSQLESGNAWEITELHSTGVTEICSAVVPDSAHLSPKAGKPVEPSTNNAITSSPADSVPAEAIAPSWSRITVPVLPADSAVKWRVVSAGVESYGGPEQVVIDHACGLPARSLWCGWGDPNAFWYYPSTVRLGPIVNGIDLSSSGATQPVLRGLPYGIIWPGFAINTIFYGGLCWLLVAAPFAVRRLLRLGRGQCPACAYPVGTSSTCTECGKPVTAPAGSAP